MVDGSNEPVISRSPGPSRVVAMPSTSEDRARAAFVTAFATEPTTLGRAPGRVELLGNHTDYNAGLVLAAAIDRSTVVVGRPSAGRLARVHSVNLERSDAFDVDQVAPGGWSQAWERYLQGVTWALLEEFGPMASGFDAAVAGDVPIGAGLSSSASLQAAFAMFLEGARIRGDLESNDRLRLAETLRRSENEFVGVASGLLDQFSSLFGRAGHAFVLDCLTLEHESLPLGNPAPAIVVCDSKTSRFLTDGLYNRRRAECDTVVTHFRELDGQAGIGSLRQITLDMLMSEWDRIDPTARLRARHVLTENDRVRQGAKALRAGDVVGFGALMSASHASSRDDFANSSPALDALIEAAEASPGFLGGKLSGAGWAGCTVNLVRSELASEFALELRAGYARKTGIEADIHICHAAEGASWTRLE